MEFFQSFKVPPIFEHLVGFILVCVLILIATILWEIARGVSRFTRRHKRFVSVIGFILIMAAFAWLAVQIGLDMFRSEAARPCFDQGMPLTSEVCRGVQESILVILLGFVSLALPVFVVWRLYGNRDDERERRNRGDPPTVTFTGIRDVYSRGPESATFLKEKGGRAHGINARHTDG